MYFFKVFIENLYFFKKKNIKIIFRVHPLDNVKKYLEYINQLKKKYNERAIESNGLTINISPKEINQLAETRLKQHKYSVRTGQESNALFVHLRDTKHCIDWDNAS